MNKETIDRLIEAAEDSDREALQVLHSAWEKKFGLYKGDDCRSNLQEWQAAERALKIKIDELSAKYLDDVKAPPLENLMGVVRFLKDQGYKIAKSKVYNDEKGGLIKVNPDGTVNESEARAYAQKAGLKKIKSGKEDDGKINEYLRDKALEELKNIRMKNERLEFEMERDRGLWLRREDAETQFAIKMGAIEAQMKDVIRFRAGDWIHAVGGNPKKADVLIDMANADVDHRFNQLAEIEELEIIIRLPVMAEEESDDWGGNEDD